MSRKRHFAGQGLVAQDSLNTIFQREIFFQVDPATLDHYNPAELQEMAPSGTHVDINPDDFLPYLPELEQEIFWLVFVRQKGQKDIAKLLGLSQPTISYRYRRVLAKLEYLMVLLAVDTTEILTKLTFLKNHEQAILKDLLFHTNQELVGKKHNVRQSSVKWIFLKAKRKTAEMERVDPDRWSKALGLLLLLERHLSSRIKYE